MNNIMPTVGRIVLVTIAGPQGPVVVPAIVTAVHSIACISVVAFSAFNMGGFHAAGTRPMSSIEYDEDPAKVNTWWWMPVQTTGGGFDARITALEKASQTTKAKPEKKAKA